MSKTYVEKLLECILIRLGGSVSGGGGNTANQLTRTTANKTGNYTIAAGFVHAMVDLPTASDQATVDGIPLVGPINWQLPSNYPARHGTAVVIVHTAGEYYVSETR